MNASLEFPPAIQRAARTVPRRSHRRSGKSPVNGVSPHTLVPGMASTVCALLAWGKGLLAADESPATMARRFESLGVAATAENFLSGREMLFTTPGLGEFISGVILSDETLRQRTARGTPVREILAAQGIIFGVKADAGTMELPGFAGERVTNGLDGLRERLAGYRQLGARFSKWRAAIAIGKYRPTKAGLDENARALAVFAALSQEAGLVPLVELEILLDGSHTQARCEDVMGAALNAVFTALFDHRVVLELMVLNTSMVLSGSKCARPVAEGKTAEATLRCLRRTVPAAVPGIVFLSSEQNDVVATERLDAICRRPGAPWRLSFSFGRALQDAPLKAWNGQPSNVSAAQAALRLRAMCNSLAVQGKY